MHSKDTLPRVYISGGLWTYILEELERQGRHYIPLEHKAKVQVTGLVNTTMLSSRNGTGEQLLPTI
ncbi:hypothetical protein PUNSTDRAFT_135137 [Punctularia strigosozonata HHB-11173 SS5]|uniref:uncharacterized protein n=1 Tax=Punctularia strigosozonata (strain HHB-11173) TaxID=741275 RepID=UPI0004417641|nr:uncharacterized protein PUNSTDRAFT_135137 [Punctularia strigosozonata HHB-11173 SS5]EIN07614.1 hypothetical protein PUNSTDRAFT_135137 [Punctularia strigosozonata HHB-11173 SS5]